MKIQKYKCRLVKDGVVNITDSKNEINHVEVAVKLFKKIMFNLPHEEMHVLFLNNKYNILGEQCISIGGTAGAAFYPRDLFRGAIAINASMIMLSHNHPSLDVKPSDEDIQMTRVGMEAGKLLGIPILDHIIVGGDNYYSFSEDKFVL